MNPSVAPVPTFRDLDDAHRPVPGRNVLGVVRFARESAAPSLEAGFPSVTVHLAETEAEGFAEVWSTERPVETGRSGTISYAHDGEFLFCATRVSELPDYVDATETAYGEALELAHVLGYRQLYRIWHYISRINEPNAAGLEVYREFCVGRSRALERYGITHDMPAATVIGAHDGGIVLYFLACRSATQVNVDNPRQVPPSFYPNRYGPRSPTFARATYLAPGAGEQIHVSGTAGILGHRTMHLGDVEQQCRLALENIEHLVSYRNLSVYDLEAGGTLRELDNVKVYVRHRSDLDRVRRICQEVLPPSTRVQYLRADICRADLLVELEGVITRDRATVAAARDQSGETRRGTAHFSAAPAEWEVLPADQQPEWRAHPAYKRVMDRLSEAPPLVRPAELDELRAGLARVARGEARVLQAGDCAESFYETPEGHITRRLAELDRVADLIAERSGQPVVRIGRLGGQYAKPRSEPVETVDGRELPVFRGHMINAEWPVPEARRHEPQRMLWAYQFSAATHRLLRARREGTAGGEGPWSSSEALVMDYVGTLVRRDERTGERFLGTTHLPWLGERTGGTDQAQAKLLSLVRNPVACKVGPRATPESVLRLCAMLDPDREPGRLTLIVRMGRGRVADLLPPIARAVRDAGHPVVWLCDPMHGNTERLASGAKVRSLDHLADEAVLFRVVLEGHGLHMGGLHLETSPDAVTECLGGEVSAVADLDRNNTTLCDPRLNPAQAAELIDRVF